MSTRQMTELTDTNSAGIASEFLKARKRAGSPAMGMVMTLIVVVDEDAAVPWADEPGARARHHRSAGEVLVPRPLGGRRRRDGDAVARGLPVAPGVQQEAAALVVVEDGGPLERVPVVDAAVHLAVGLVALPVRGGTQDDLR
jgi:hypothetical protein